MNIFGLRAQDGFPVCELLERNYDAPEDSNLREIASTAFSRQASLGRVFDGIMVVAGGDASFVFSFK